MYSPALHGGLWRVPASGGRGEPLTHVASEGDSHRWPDVLPGGTAFLYTVFDGGSLDDDRIVLRSLETGEENVLVHGGTHGRYVNGHVIYARGGLVLAAPFDANEKALTGPATPLQANVAVEPASGLAHIAVATDRAIYAYVSARSAETVLVHVDRNGEFRPLSAERGSHLYPRTSPDGSRVSVTIAEQSSYNVWVFGVDRNRWEKLTHRGRNYLGIWSPDGETITYTSDQEGPYNLFRRVGGVSRPPERLLEDPRHQWANGWIAAPETLLFTQLDQETGYDIWAVEAGQEARPYHRTDFDEQGAAASPDGRWVTYLSNHSGRYEVYLGPFRGTETAVQISVGGGVEPTWSSDGSEIYYRNHEKMLRVTLEGALSAVGTEPEVLFEQRFEMGRLPGIPNYSVLPNGDGFVMVHAPVERSTPSTIDVVLYRLDGEGFAASSR